MENTWFTLMLLGSEKVNDMFKGTEQSQDDIFLNWIVTLLSMFWRIGSKFIQVAMLCEILCFVFNV